MDVERKGGGLKRGKECFKWWGGLKGEKRNNVNEALGVPKKKDSK